MARALECPACGARHRLDTLPTEGTFRCDRCGQVLKVPAGVTATQPSAAASGAAPAGIGAPPPPPRRGSAPTQGARVSATATIPAAASSAPDGNGARGRPRPADAATPTKGSKVHWYWRVLAWIVAVPLGLALTGWPALHFDLLKKDDLLDVFVGEGTGRYTRLLVFAAVWALVTALLVQLFVEGGQYLARRRAQRAASA